MSALITNYNGLVSALATWLLRDGDSVITSRADDYIALCEQRMYLGGEAIAPLGIPAHEAIRIPPMYQTNTTFALAQNAAQPSGMLELIEAAANSTDVPAPMQIVEESIIDSQSPFETGTPRMIALSGTNFRLWPDPGTGSYTATLRWYGALSTPSASNATNWILTNAPSVYLNGCLLEASLATGDFDNAVKYGMLYGSAANSLNTQRNRRLALAQNVRIRMRGYTP